ncbi:MAG: YbaN family protein [Paracoccaceae bacterium]
MLNPTKPKRGTPSSTTLGKIKGDVPTSSPYIILMATLWTVGGLVALALGLIGIPLPILPTTPFILLSAFCFAKGSPRLRQWITTHPKFGPIISNWEQHGAIPKRAKRVAVTLMAATLGLSLFMGLSFVVIAIQAICLGGAAIFVLTRPDEPKDT